MQRQRLLQIRVPAGEAKKIEISVIYLKKFERVAGEREVKSEK